MKPKLWFLILVSIGGASSVVAQVSPVSAGSGFVPGGRVIFATDFTQDALGDFPKGLKYLRGSLEVVEKDGIRALRATGPSEFLISLPEALPQSFTLEFDMIGRTCCFGEELAFEGTAFLSRSTASAQVLLFPQFVVTYGGGPTLSTEVKKPEDLQGETLGQLAQVKVSFDGPSFKLYINEKRLYNIPELRFIRGRVLRVFLGGADENDGAVYLTRIRVAGGPATGRVAIEQQKSGQTGAGIGGQVASGTIQEVAPSTPAAPGTPVTGPSVAARTNTPAISSGPIAAGGPAIESKQSASNAAPVPTFVAGVSVSQGPAGPVVTWLPVAAQATYTVLRWKSDDRNCCTNSSPVDQPLSGPPWQDSPPPFSGMYTYRVTIQTSAGTADGETQFLYQKPGGQIAAVGSAPISSGPRTVTVVPPPSSTPTVSIPTAPGALVTGPAPATINGLIVTMGAAGPVVSWTALKVSAGYHVQRWKIDDGTCCNNSSGRGWLSGSPWQDNPLPVSGTYVYRLTAQTANATVLAETQFGYRKPEGVPVAPPPAPIAAVPVAAPTGTITPMAPPPPPPPTRLPSPRPAGKPTAVNSNGPAPTNLTATGTPTTATLSWDAVPGAVGYRISRALAGTTLRTQLTPAPITATSSAPDVLPDPKQTYTYQVLAYQADGSFGAATVDFTAPAAIDPSGFSATATAAGTVELTWQLVPGVAGYLISGPGTGSGISVQGSKQTVTGLPAGTHTWRIASNYQPGGILTPSASWPSASATLAATSGRYQISVESVLISSQSVDNIFDADGKGNEIYVTAVVDVVGRMPSSPRGQRTQLRSATHGDVTSRPPPARVRAGSAGPNGGLLSRDLVAPIWAQPTAGSGGYSRFVLWEGTLTDGGDVVVIRPMVWESDEMDHGGTDVWDYQEFYQYWNVPTARLLPGYSQQDTDETRKRLADADLTPIVAPEFPFTPTIDALNLATNPSPCAAVAANGGACFVFQLFAANDRPIGLARNWEIAPMEDYAVWFDRKMLVTREAIERALTGSGGDPGLISIRLVDHELNGANKYATLPYYGFGDYTLNIRIVRLP